jgi:hypothetical protein
LAGKKRAAEQFLVLAILGGGLGYWSWKKGESKRATFVSLHTLDQALKKNDSSELLKVLVLPQAVHNKTPAEQTEFLVKALRDEISPEGLAELKAKGRFGPLTNLFPQEAAQWASQAGVPPGECMAFRLDRTNGFRAEVVLHRSSSLDTPLIRFRIIRCNNVKPPAEPRLSNNANEHEIQIGAVCYRNLRSRARAEAAY